MQNVLEYVRILESKGVPKDQAECYVFVVIEMMNKGFSTKHDLEKLALTTKAEFEKLRLEIEQRFQAMSSDIDQQFTEVNFTIKGLAKDMYLKLGSIIIGSTTVLGTFIAVFK